MQTCSWFNQQAQVESDRTRVHMLSLTRPRPERCKYHAGSMNNTHNPSTQQEPANAVAPVKHTIQLLFSAQQQD